MTSKFFALAVTISVALLSACSPANNNGSEESRRAAAQTAFLAKFEQNPYQFINEVFKEENCILSFEGKRDNPYRAYESDFQVNLSKISSLKMVYMSARDSYWQVNIDDIHVRASMSNGEFNLLSRNGQKVVLHHMYNYLSEKMKKCNINTPLN